MARVEVTERRTCDTDCGHTDGGSVKSLKARGWGFHNWNDRYIELCPVCNAKAERNPVIKKALENTSIAGKFGPEADCG